MQIWRMRADGSQQEQVTSDEFNNWFPHPSPDGKWLVFLSYEKDVKGHPENKDVTLRLMPLAGGKIEVLAKLFGGQGTINVPVVVAGQPQAGIRQLPVLRGLEQSGQIARIKGNRYIQPREADLIPGRIRMNRQGKGFSPAGRSEPQGNRHCRRAPPARRLHEDRVLVRRDVRPKGLRPDAPSRTPAR